MNGKMNDDAPLLRRYAREGSEAAFRELVERYVALVNSTARRMTGGNVHLAQDVTQLVFTHLARKAGALPEGVVVGGWLHRHTCYTALKALRSENRRRHRERTAMEINTINDNTGQDAHWLELAPVLDAALNRLDAADRDAIVLRYYQQCDVRSVGTALGASESAAQKRLGRALERLRGILIRSGVTVASAAALGSTLEASPVTVSTPGMAACISAQALGNAALAAKTSLTLATLKTIMTTKLALGFAAVAAVGSIAAVLIIKNTSTAVPTLAANVPTAVPNTHPLVYQTNSPTPMAVNPVKVAAPVAAPVPAGGDVPASDPTPDPFANSGDSSINSGNLTWTSSPNILTSSVVTNGVLALPGNASASTNRRVTIQSNSAGGLNPMATAKFMATLNQGNQENLGTPDSSEVNADSSTTNTYTGPNGETVIMNKSADGQATSVRVTSTPDAQSSNSNANVMIITAPPSP
ncbi:MAG TPA: sigma-70 family RNA polymerase sigma factor [Opitutales bacterium]|jgi:RNA polymerase sigma factor (sigma-70 family)|nr:sigma-70 family RNA polymerase sigma factor [Opitutales bacterium]